MLLIGILTATNASAQPSDRFPESTTVVVEGERFAAFNLGGFTELLSIDADLVASGRLVTNLQDSLLEHELLNDQLSLAIDTQDAIIDILEQERDRLRRLWQNENLARLQAENNPNIGSWIGWGLAGALGVATLILALVLGVN